MAPIIIGVVMNTFAPKLCRAIEPACPMVGVATTVLLVGASVSQCAPAILSGGWGLQLAIITLHLVGGFAGYTTIK